MPNRYVAPEILLPSVYAVPYELIFPYPSKEVPFIVTVDEVILSELVPTVVMPG